MIGNKIQLHSLSLPDYVFYGQLYRNR